MYTWQAVEGASVRAHDGASGGGGRSDDEVVSAREGAASRSGLDLEQVADRVGVVTPLGVGVVPSNQRLGIG